MPQLIMLARVFSHLDDFNVHNKFSLQKFSNGLIGIINFETFFSPNFIADNMNWFQNSMTVENVFYIRALIGARIYSEVVYKF